MNSAKDRFSGLVQRLKDCQTLETRINPKLLHETWSSFRRLDPEHGDEVTPALLVSLILSTWNPSARSSVTPNSGSW